MKFLLFLLFPFLLTSCTNGQAGNENSEGHANTADMSYWYQGKAELSSYDLKQSRYGEVREGHAVLVFVSEPFNLEKQVKTNNREEVLSTNVLKLNFTKKFVTGIYPYSLMTSTFTPIDRQTYPHTLKVSNSNQDWCGQTFMQLNLNGDAYEVKQFSYFESEGDMSKSIEVVLLEDEVWNLIRMAPENLPEGKIRIYPSTQHIRLRHKENRVYDAMAKKESFDDHNIYTLEYEDRILSINYEKESPYRINGWTEKLLTENGDAPENLTTSASLKERVLVDYWNKNSVADSTWRVELGLE